MPWDPHFKSDQKAPPEKPSGKFSGLSIAERKKRIARLGKSRKPGEKPPVIEMNLAAYHCRGCGREFTNSEEQLADRSEYCRKDAKHYNYCDDEICKRERLVRKRKGSPLDAAVGVLSQIDPPKAFRDYVDGIVDAAEAARVEIECRQRARWAMSAKQLGAKLARLALLADPLANLDEVAREIRTITGKDYDRRAVNQQRLKLRARFPGLAK